MRVSPWTLMRTVSPWTLMRAAPLDPMRVDAFSRFTLAWLGAGRYKKRLIG